MHGSSGRPGRSRNSFPLNYEPDELQDLRMRRREFPITTYRV
jgi:hypothetical protein